MRIDFKICQFSKTLSAIAPDKSMSHRAALFALLADAPVRVKNYLYTGDCLNTLELVKALGARVEIDAQSTDNRRAVEGPLEAKNLQSDSCASAAAHDDASANLDCAQTACAKTASTACARDLLITPPKQILSPAQVLDCGNAGTLMRLAIGLLAGIEGEFVLSGDRHLNARPMRRISAPLKQIGAHIFGRDEANFAPLFIKGARLPYFALHNNLLSAQVKSAAILAGLLGAGCEITEAEQTREHSEQLLKKMGADIQITPPDGAKPWHIKVAPLNGRKLSACEINIGNDPSSAFFFAALCAIVPHSELRLENILLNSSRIEAYRVLERMGVQLQIIRCEADLGTMVLKSPERLRAVQVSENISWLIDEIPALCVVMAHAVGTSVIKNAAELRVKECDRIAASVKNLRACGVECEEFADGLAISGKSGICASDQANERTSEQGDRQGGKSAPACQNEPWQICSFADHRIAMAFSLMCVHKAVEIDDASCVSVSFSNFFDILKGFACE